MLIKVLRSLGDYNHLFILEAFMKVMCLHKIHNLIFETMTAFPRLYYARLNYTTKYSSISGLVSECR